MDRDEGRSASASRKACRSTTARSTRRSSRPRSSQSGRQRGPRPRPSDAALTHGPGAVGTRPRPVRGRECERARTCRGSTVSSRTRAVDILAGGSGQLGRFPHGDAYVELVAVRETEGEARGKRVRSLRRPRARCRRRPVAGRSVGRSPRPISTALVRLETVLPRKVRRARVREREQDVVELTAPGPCVSAARLGRGRGLGCRPDHSSGAWKSVLSILPW